GGLTRLVDKRKVRRDLADVFCTTAEGVRADRAKQWKLVDHTAPPARFADLVQERARALCAMSGRSGDAKPVMLPPLERRIDDKGYHYRWVDVAFDRAGRVATLTVSAPGENGARSLAAIEAAGARWWPLAMARELDDAILMLRTNELELGTLLLKTRGSVGAVLENDRLMAENGGHWFVREVRAYLRRTLARLDVSSRSLFAIIERGSCFAGTLFELALAADRSYMLALEAGDNDAPRLALSAANMGMLAMINGWTRLANRFCGDDAGVGEAVKACWGKELAAEEALAVGLVTFAPDELDWEDEIRLAVEERASLSPDALTGLEASLRFAGEETMLTRIFGRLSAWQNWIFNRPNAVGEQGALKLFGTGSKPQFNWERV
ncbi:MAG TPA: benzoyl-CoA-dihydrodiol lyase, partial [Stellaceae bacterium]|nr:benzoyl-CoA-dihydrodiol lyase [Stellaceae bacterium]